MTDPRIAIERVLQSHILPDEFPVLPAVRLKHAARVCPLLEDRRDAAAWIACCSKRFHPVAKRIAADNDLALDALQESWSKIFEAAHAYRGDPPACAWVRAIIANTAQGLARARGRRRSQEVPLAEGTEPLADSRPTPEELARDMQLLELLREMVATLPETYREVLELRYGRQLDTGETAELLHISRSNVASRLHRAVAFLQKRIEARLNRTRRHLRETKESP